MKLAIDQGQVLNLSIFKSFFLRCFKFYHVLDFSEQWFNCFFMVVLMFILEYWMEPRQLIKDLLS